MQQRRGRGRRANGDEATWAAIRARTRALRGSVATPNGLRKRTCPGPCRKEEQRRRSGTTGRGSLSKSPDCPLLLDAASVDGGEPVRPTPGASEWDSLARVRRGVLKPVSQRRPPGGPNKESCCATCGGRASTRGRCATAASGAGDVRGPPLRLISEMAMKVETAMAIDGDAGSGPQGRGAFGAPRHADDVVDASASRVARFAPAARARRGDALGHGAEAEAKQRRGAAVAARAGRATQRR